MKFRLLILALGTFAIGTDSFLVAGVLPSVSSSLGISLSAAGQLVTVFSLAYALAAPILGALTGNLNRKPVLIGGILLFAVANFASALAPNYAFLMLTRVLAALGAGLFTPTATTTAALLALPDRRGRALALVVGGLTVATVAGVPLGTWTATLWNWRAPFALVGGLGVLAAASIALMFAPVASPGAASIQERLRVAGQRPVLFGLLLTITWTIGGFTVYTYLGELLRAVGVPENRLSLVLLLYGASSVAGGWLGGIGADRFGTVRTIVTGLSALCAAFVALGAAVAIHVSPIALGISLVAIFVWGVAGWMLTAPQQHRLMTLAGPSSGIVLSLNSSSIYLGISIGSLLGGLALRFLQLPALGFIGAAFQLVALGLLFCTNISMNNQNVANGTIKAIGKRVYQRS